MTSTRTAIVLGGSGSVGTALLRELLHDDGFKVVITLSRQSIREAVAMARTTGRTLVEKLVPDMTPAPLAAATIDAARELDGEGAWRHVGNELLHQYAAGRTSHRNGLG